MLQKIALPPDKADDVDRALRAIHDALPQLDAAEQCGMDCTAERAALAEMQQKLEAMREHFGHGRRSAGR